MKYRTAVLCVLLPTALAWSQTPTRPNESPANRINRLSKAFPPEIVDSASEHKTLKPRQRNCTYLSPDRKTLSFKPCQAPAKQTPAQLRRKLFP